MESDKMQFSITSQHNRSEVARICWQPKIMIKQKKDITVDKGLPIYGIQIVCRNLTVFVFVLSILLYGIGANPNLKICHGEWGQWIGFPEPGCKLVNLTRYRPIKGNEPCYAESEVCCIDVVEHSCFDFAYNTSVNIKLLRCANFGSITTDPVTQHLMCKCRAQNTGVRCEIDLCMKECKNGGTCEVAANHFICLCKPEFTGSECQFEVINCNEIGICKNGGICTPASTGMDSYCKCAPGFKGRKCEDPEASVINREKPSYDAHIAVGVLLLLLILIIIIVAAYVRNKQKNIDFESVSISPAAEENTFAQALKEMRNRRFSRVPQHLKGRFTSDIMTNARLEQSSKRGKRWHLK